MEREPIFARVVGVQAPSLDQTGRVTIEVSDVDFGYLVALLGVELKLRVSTVEMPPIRPGGMVEYRPVLGRDDFVMHEVADGPFVIDTRTCWKLKGKAGVVDQNHLTPTDAHHG